METNDAKLEWNHRLGIALVVVPLLLLVLWFFAYGLVATSLVTERSNIATELASNRGMDVGELIRHFDGMPVNFANKRVALFWLPWLVLICLRSAWKISNRTWRKHTFEDLNWNTLLLVLSITMLVIWIVACVTTFRTETALIAEHFALKLAVNENDLYKELVGICYLRSITRTIFDCIPWIILTIYFLVRYYSIKPNAAAGQRMS